MTIYLYKAKSLEFQEVKTMFGKNSKVGKSSTKSNKNSRAKNVEASSEAKGKTSSRAKNVEASSEAKGCSSKTNSSAKNCK